MKSPLWNCVISNEIVSFQQLFYYITLCYSINHNGKAEPKQARTISLCLHVLPCISHPCLQVRWLTYIENRPNFMFCNLNMFCTFTISHQRRIQFLWSCRIWNDAAYAQLENELGHFEALMFLNHSSSCAAGFMSCPSQLLPTPRCRDSWPRLTQLVCRLRSSAPVCHHEVILLSRLASRENDDGSWSVLSAQQGRRILTPWT